MANKQVQFRRGTALQNDGFVGAEGEITVDTDNFNARLHDGITPGGKAFLMDGDVVSGGGSSGPDRIMVSAFEKNLATPGVFYAFVSPGDYEIGFFNINLSVETPPTQATSVFMDLVNFGGTSSVAVITIGTDGTISDLNSFPASIYTGDKLIFYTTNPSDLTGLAFSFFLQEGQISGGPPIEFGPE